MTSSTITHLAPTLVALEFTVTEAELSAAEDRAFRKLARDVRLPGFRKGKVPRKVFEQAYGSDAVTSRAVDELVPEVYAKAVREHDLEPVKAPELEVLEESGGRPSRMKATVEVRPTIDLGAYKGVKVPRPPDDVTDDDVERSLQALARERATLVPAERAAQLGDVVTIDYEGRVAGEPFEGGKGTGEIVELAEERFIPGFASGIAGMRPSETKEVEAQFPEGYPASELAGQTATFTVTLHELKELELPSLDDGFAQAVSENQTLDDLRADLRRRLEAVAAGRGRRAIGNAVMARLLEAHDFPLPTSMVDREMDHLVEDAVGATKGTGDPPDRESFRAEAESRVKGSLLIQEIAKAENIVATPADLAAELEALARRYGQPVGRIRTALGNNVLSLMDGIVRYKTLDFLIDNAEAVDEETLGSAS